MAARVKLDTTGCGVGFGVDLGVAVATGVGAAVAGGFVGLGVIALSSGGGVSPRALATDAQAPLEFPLCRQLAYVSVEEVLPRLQLASSKQNAIVGTRRDPFVDV
jgi:hypothetical protein